MMDTVIIIPYSLVQIIERLNSAAFDEIGRIYGVKKELERLKMTVETIRDVLLDAEKKRARNAVVQHRIRSLRDVLDSADNLLDELVVKDMRHKVNRGGIKNKVIETQFGHSYAKQNTCRLKKVAHRIEDLTKNLTDLMKEIYVLRSGSSVVVAGNLLNESSGVRRRESWSFRLKESDIIGREHDKKEVISLLMKPCLFENVSLSSVAIVGIGGLGKTTVAQMVYNDVEVQNFFEKRMWVWISECFDVKTIFMRMLVSLGHSNNTFNDDGLTLDLLERKLQQCLTGKRYLLVMDDTWNENYFKWTELRSCLMCGAKGSKILVTTRCQTVAQKMGVSNPYVLNGLTPIESWRALKKIAFGSDAIGVDGNLEAIGRKIAAEKCRGVPLAMETVGGMLRHKRKEWEWSYVLNCELWNMCKEDEDSSSIMSVLKPSYQNLSPQQRQCFEYCAIYPKGWIIIKDDLIQLWMAQGYLGYSDEKQDMENVGNQLVKIFLMKSFFQDVEITEDGGIVSFKMHDLMHDLAMQVAEYDCCYLDNSQARMPLAASPKHVSLKPDALGLLDSLDASRLRSLILLSSATHTHRAGFDGHGGQHLNKEQMLVISKFRYLRVLKLTACSLSKLYGSVGKMKHLRYLNLSSCGVFKNLSECINNLVCLQTLTLYCHFYGKVELSRETVSRLINLRNCSIINWEGSRDYGCQDRDLDRKIVRFYDPTSLQRPTVMSKIDFR